MMIKMTSWRKRLQPLMDSGKGALVVLLLSLLTGCGEDPTQLLETARFEEQQNNLLHAQELYEQIIRDHPDSPQAQTAKERMAELRKAPMGKIAP